jgi:hypothetical protein
MFGPWLDHVWTMFRPCSDHVWASLRHIWAMFGRCLDHVWAMPGSCLGHVWTMFGPCLGYVWTMFRSFVVSFLGRFCAVVGPLLGHVFTMFGPGALTYLRWYIARPAIIGTVPCIYIYISMCSQWVSSCRVEWQCTSACVPCSVSLGQCHSAAVPVRASGRSQLPVPAAGAQHQAAAFAEASSLFKTPHVFIGRIIMVKFRCFYIDTCA